MEVLQRATKIFLLLLLTSNKFFCQEANKFYLTNDTIRISNPIIIFTKGNAGRIITSYDEYSKVNDVKKLLNESKAFIYFDDSMGLGFYINEVWKKNNLKISECECCDKTNSTVKGNTIIIKFPLSSMSFYLGFTKASFYKKNVITADMKKTIKIKNDQQFYPILFPLCE